MTTGEHEAEAIGDSLGDLGALQGVQDHRGVGLEAKDQSGGAVGQ